MCIIAVLPKGEKIEKNTFKTMWNNNPDGGGYMFAYKGKIYVKKEMKLKPLWKQFEKDRTTHPDTNFVLHFRIGTSGFCNLDNTHPFRITDNLYFCHNGILSNFEKKGSDASDTRHFNAEILQPLLTGQEHLIKNFAIQQMLGSYITGSKFAILNHLGDVVIINEQAGQYDGKIWYSNGNYKASKYNDYSQYNHIGYGNTKAYNWKGSKYNQIRECDFCHTILSADHIGDLCKWCSGTGIDYCRNCFINPITNDDESYCFDCKDLKAMINGQMEY